MNRSPTSAVWWSPMRHFRSRWKAKPRPANIDGFTPEQRFFLGYARGWAESIRPELARLLVNSDPHPLAQVSGQRSVVEHAAVRRRVSMQGRRCHGATGEGPLRDLVVRLRSPTVSEATLPMTKSRLIRSKREHFTCASFIVSPRVLLAEASQITSRSGSLPERDCGMARSSV